MYTPVNDCPLGQQYDNQLWVFTKLPIIYKVSRGNILMERTHNYRETSRSLIIGQPSSNPSVATPPSYYRRIRRGVITYYQGIEGALPLIFTYGPWIDQTILLLIVLCFTRPMIV